MNAEILCVGTELLLGDIINTNAPYIARGLAAIGINVFRQSVVGDNPERLKEALRLALRENDCVITTGGLGPTYDDLTKETMAELFGIKMELNQEALDRIQMFFDKIGREMTDNNKKQAWMPQGAVVFYNENGTAPGLAVEKDGKRVVLLPGPPREMEPMFTQQVIPYLSGLSDRVLVSSNIRIFGVGESGVEQRLREMMLHRTNPTIAPYAKDGEVLLRVTASGRNREEAKQLIQPVVDEIASIYPEEIYGIDVDSLQEAAVQALMEKGMVLATAESCTGGLISKRITEIPGASQVFTCGVCSYANEIKESVLFVKHETLEKFGAVSSQTAMEMAEGVRKASGADIGVSTTGIAGPDGGTPEKPVGLVYVGISSDAFSHVLCLHLSRGYREEREYIRYVASSHALHLVLKAVKASPNGSKSSKKIGIGTQGVPDSERN